jgi:hypothetical protein
VRGVSGNRYPYRDPDQHGFGDNGTESTGPGQDDDQMNEYDSEVAHPGNRINTSKTTALSQICQFAIHTHQFWVSLVSLRV